MELPSSIGNLSHLTGARARAPFFGPDASPIIPRLFRLSARTFFKCPPPPPPRLFRLSAPVCRWPSDPAGSDYERIVWMFLRSRPPLLVLILSRRPPGRFSWRVPVTTYAMRLVHFFAHSLCLSFLQSCF